MCDEAEKITNLNCPKNQNEKNEKFCSCGSPVMEKIVQVGWGHEKISICINSNCPYKNKKKKIGWGE